MLQKDAVGDFHDRWKLTSCCSWFCDAYILKWGDFSVFFFRGEALFDKRKNGVGGIEGSNLALMRVLDAPSLFEGRSNKGGEIVPVDLSIGRRACATGPARASDRITLARCFLRTVWPARFRLFSLSPRLCGRLSVHPQARRTANNHRQPWTRNGVRKRAFCRPIVSPRRLASEGDLSRRGLTF